MAMPMPHDLAPPVASMTQPTTYDFILSSGFLAFGRQAGFLAGTRECGIQAARVYGTSSGALIGAMHCAGWSLARILREVGAERPMARMGLSWRPWRGVFQLEPLMAHLKSVLPPRLEDLPIPLAVGVQRADGSFAFIQSGPLAPAVAASCAMPWVFQPVTVELDGNPEACRDGGAVDRTGVDAWRKARGQEATGILHLVDRTAGAQNATDFSDLLVVRSERSGAGFWSLGAVDERAEESRAVTVACLSEMSGLRDSNGDQSSRNH